MHTLLQILFLLNLEWASKFLPSRATYPILPSTAVRSSLGRGGPFTPRPRFAPDGTIRSTVPMTWLASQPDDEACHTADDEVLGPRWAGDHSPSLSASSPLSMTPSGRPNLTTSVEVIFASEWPHWDRSRPCPVDRLLRARQAHTSEMEGRTQHGIGNPAVIASIPCAIRGLHIGNVRIRRRESGCQSSVIRSSVV